MDWTYIKRHWTQISGVLLRRFPYANKHLVETYKGQPEVLTRHLAETHHLTVAEAREELRDWIMIQSLARDAMGAGLSDAHLQAAQ